MLKRTITSAVILLVIVPVLYFWQTPVLPVFVALLSLLGVHEMLGCVGMRRTLIVSIPAYCIAAAAPLGVRLFDSIYEFVSLYALVMFCFLVLSLSGAVFSRGALDVEKIGFSYAAVFYVITAFSAMILLCGRPFGIYLLVVTIFGPWISDVFAYLTGRVLGRHKLIPEVSPKKTVEGAIGGVVFSSLAVVLYGFCLSRLIDDVERVGYPALVFSGIVISVV